MQVVPSICTFCGVGCGIGLRVEGRRVIGVEPQPGHPVSQGQLCSKGWSTSFAIDTADRLTRPLIREAGGFRPASWDEALGRVAGAFRQALAESGPEAVGVISCARATNEDNYAAQKFARAVLGTHNIDHCARICHSPSVAGLSLTLGSGAMTGSIADIDAADLILLIGTDTTENHAMIGARILRAQARGARLVVVDPRRTRLARLADQHIQLRLGSNIALLNGLLQIIFANGWENRAFLDERCENVEILRQHVAGLTPELTSAQTGVPVAELERLAQAVSHAQAAFIAYGMGITQFQSGTNNVVAVSNLALVCGQVGRPGAGIYPLRGQNNVQGACDMGCLPNVYPGYQPATSAEVQARFAQAWGVPLPQAPGLTSLGMTTAALAGDFKALMIMGEEPVLTDPDQHHVERALRALDFLVVVELTMTETAKLADVVLPAASFAEKDGTFTNCERRVQRIRRAVGPPGEAWTDWQILGALAARMGYLGMIWADAQAIFDEMAALTPLFCAMSYPALDIHHGLHWPCDAAHPQGSPLLHAQGFPRGRGRLLPVSQVDPDECPDADYPFFFTTQRLHFHYGGGSMTRKSPLLERETPAGLLFIHPQDAADLRLQDGQGVRLRSRRGTLETRAQITDDVPPGTLSMPYHFREAPCNILTNSAQDPQSKMPELKACAVAIEPLPPGVAPRLATALDQEVGDDRL
ncbi:formate dehydrogenase subunit alpha [Pseudomonas sp. MAP12]|uniref:Formate dehydrogenase subunit alpha n=1 Tax=Geopseudomonas aromaticivorans TaxID=2849492 RepID=A0ABS6MT45_9GAMM|nr:formate dehydrogenase subunit alpha [Pseudomonas aromaticivorans]MBV2131978.1 formate dehydrogenase subunit alpha [Pseudomonas aromaticivorans]